ncbi:MULTISPECIES: biopolymer transporter ExbD [unclassified Marinobacter]|uniref:ExbD/TolR family protein n=1 Tax=unclassified Marinobacter TaxID=83889 RepID=UPI0026E47376|nr:MULTISPECIES: biopolymer transporter ExbD [unclassified Marinobacter]MDO6443236.1 biopolymer transporter ExbD [Marinobacter sp. 2_MG-2023]MDO6824367.1 biopolymer transporter ExbD [Marinobacter sp. 1_MG-2023]
MQLVEPRPNRPIPIRITPLIDVVFILLVFFMLTSRLLPVDHLELANNTDGRSTVTGEPLPLLIVTEGGEIEWQELALPIGQILPQLRSAGISEVNLTTAPGTQLSLFTSTLGELSRNGIQTHWKRATEETP